MSQPNKGTDGRNFAWVDKWVRMTGERAKIDAKANNTYIIYKTENGWVKEYPGIKIVPFEMEENSGDEAADMWPNDGICREAYKQGIEQGMQIYKFWMQKVPIAEISKKLDISVEEIESAVRSAGGTDPYSEQAEE